MFSVQRNWQFCLKQDSLKELINHSMSLNWSLYENLVKDYCKIFHIVQDFKYFLQLLDIDTVAVDLLSLLVIWLQGDSTRKLPYPVSSNLSRLLDPLHITLSLKVISVFSVSFSRLSPLKVRLFDIFVNFWGKRYLVAMKLLLWAHSVIFIFAI